MRWGRINEEHAICNRSHPLRRPIVSSLILQLGTNGFPLCGGGAGPETQSHNPQRQWGSDELARGAGGPAPGHSTLLAQFAFCHRYPLLSHKWMIAQIDLIWVIISWTPTATIHGNHFFKIVSTWRKRSSGFRALGTSWTSAARFVRYVISSNGINIWSVQSLGHRWPIRMPWTGNYNEMTRRVLVPSPQIQPKTRYFKLLQILYF